MSTENLKLHIIEELLSFDNDEFLLRVKNFIEKAKKSGLSKEQKIATETEWDASKMTFEEWNLQFEDDENTDINEHLPEHNMTLLEFRKMIWKGEKAEPKMSLEEFLEDQKAWRK